MAFIRAHQKREKDEMRARALMDMKHASLVARFSFGAKGQVDLMHEYPWLWSKQEQRDAKVERIRQSLEERATKGDARDA